MTSDTGFGSRTLERRCFFVGNLFINYSKCVRADQWRRRKDIEHLSHLTGHFLETCSIQEVAFNYEYLWSNGEWPEDTRFDFCRQSADWVFRDQSNRKCIQLTSLTYSIMAAADTLPEYTPRHVPVLCDLWLLCDVMLCYVMFCYAGVVCVERRPNGAAGVRPAVRSHGPHILRVSVPLQLHSALVRHRALRRHLLSSTSAQLRLRMHSFVKSEVKWAVIALIEFSICTSK